MDLFTKGAAIGNPHLLLDLMNDVIADLDAMDLSVAAHHVDHARALLERFLGKSAEDQLAEALQDDLMPESRWSGIFHTSQ